MAFAALATFGCRKGRKSEPSASAPAAAESAAPGTLPPLHVEKFVVARATGTGVDLAAITRERTVVFADLDPSLRPRAVDVVARDVEAVEGTSITRAGDVAVVTAKIGGVRGTFLVRRGAPPLSIAGERCLLEGGVAWLLRNGREVRVRVSRSGTPEAATSPAIDVDPEREVHLACGPALVAITISDGEALEIVRLRPERLDAPTRVEIEKEGELDGELRERFVLPRRDGLVVVRIGERGTALREIGEDLGPWQQSRAARLSEEADIVEVAADEAKGGPVHVLASVPASGTCKGGDPPRKIVLHEVRAADEPRVRPIVELPCGVDAIHAHLRSQGARATMWWTEAVDAAQCKERGLGAAAVVSASSDRPGARRVPVLAESVVAVGERFLAVVRPGGCAPYEAAGAGTLTWVE